MESCLEQCEYFSQYQKSILIGKLLKIEMLWILNLNSTKLEFKRRIHYDPTEYFLLINNEHKLFIHFEGSSVAVIVLNSVHQKLIFHQVFDKFEYHVLEKVTDATEIGCCKDSNSIYLWEKDVMFAYAGYFYRNMKSGATPYMNTLMDIVYSLRDFPNDCIVFQLMYLICRTSTFELDFPLAELNSFIFDPNTRKCTFFSSLGYSMNCEVNYDFLVKVDEINNHIEQNISKFPTSDELAERQKPALYKYIREAMLHNYCVTIPAKYSNLIFTRCIERLCKEKGYTYVGQVISTCAGKSDGTHSVEFADFPTAEKVSQKLIDEIDAIITCAIKNPEAPNEIVFHNPYMVRSPTFITYMNNLCDTNKFRFTYNITTNLISLTLY